MVLTAILANAQQTAPAITGPTLSKGYEGLQAMEVENQQLLAAVVLRSYAERVNGLLRELAERLQTISAHGSGSTEPGTVIDIETGGGASDDRTLKNSLCGLRVSARITR